MESGKIELLRAIAEMAYAIAKADRGLSAQERITFHKIVKEELDLDSWAAQSRFELLDEVMQPTLEKAYNEAIYDFKKYKTASNTRSEEESHSRDGESRSVLQRTE